MQKLNPQTNLHSLTTSPFILSNLRNLKSNSLQIENKQILHLTNSSRLKRNPAGHWFLKQNQKAFLLQCEKTLGIKQPSDWGSITNKQIASLGGHGILNIYRGSLKRALKSNFPEINWKDEWSRWQSPRHWHDKSNQKKFLQQIEVSLKITKPSEWGSVTCSKLLELGGSGLLKIYGSTMKALQNIFPETNWKRQWFHVTKFPKWHFDSPENSRRFLDDIAEMHSINGVNDWQRITTAVIRKSGGQVLSLWTVVTWTKGLLNKYNNSLWDALRTLYPGNSWEGFFKPNSIFRTKSTIHNVLEHSLKQLMPNEVIKVNQRSIYRIKE